MKRILIYFSVLTLMLTGGCSGEKNETSLKVMTFNLRYDNPRDSINAWPNRTGIVTNFLRTEKPDLLGMQEVLDHQYEYLDSVLTDYESVGVGRSDGARGGEMNPVFFRKDRFDLVRTITFWLSETPYIAGSQAWGAGLPRIVTWVELADRNTHDHLFYFNTHFAHDSDSARVMSAKLLMEKVDSIARGSLFVITGDFNMTPESKGYSILTGPYESVPMLRDSHDISAKRPYGPAYTFNGFSDKVGNGRIDFVFVKDGLNVLEHKTFIKKEKGVFISDHWPVMAVVDLQN